MTFTYTPGTPTDRDRVRFHIQDTDSTAAIFSDEEIAFMISEKGTWQRATIACVVAIIAKISTEPDFTADWLKVDQARSGRSYETLLKRLERDLGVCVVTVSAQPVYRSDSLQTEPPEDW